MKYIIMCGGTYPRWEQPRQLTIVYGEPIVVRTIRLLREHGISDIAISSNNDVFNQFGVPVLSHDNDYTWLEYNFSDGLWCNCFYPTDEPTTYLFGDVVYSRKAIETIINYDTDDIMFFGSKPPFSHQYPKPYIEPFAFKVVDTDHLHRAVAQVKQLYADGQFDREPIAWETWNVINGNANPNKINYSTYIGINDFTCDIDKPTEIDIITRINREIYLTEGE